MCLTNRGIKSIEELEEQLKKFTGIVEIDLSLNPIPALPYDLSEIFPKVESLNIDKITFNDLQRAIDSLCTMPNLKSLVIQLEDIEQVDGLIRKLPQLENLNGHIVDRNEIDQVESTSLISIHETPRERS